MRQPGTAPWGLCVSNADLTKLKAGIEPQNQDNKWRIWVSDQSERGNMSITFTRAMFSRDIYILHMKPGDNDSDGGYSIEALTWEQNNGGVLVSEQQAKKQVAVLSRKLLGCEIELLPE